MINATMLELIIHPMNKENILDWNKEDIKDTCYTIHYKVNEIPNEEPNGFYFYVTEIVTWTPQEKGDSIPSSYGCICYGVAYFDGIRHLYLGDEDVSANDGYLYYPTLTHLIKMFQELRKLEQKYCREEYI